MASFEVTFYGQFWVTPEAIIGREGLSGWRGEACCNDCHPPAHR
jgi:hypothetical protein